MSIIPTSGSATVYGFDIEKENLQVRQHIGYVPENVRLYNDLTVADNLSFFAALSGVDNISLQITEALDMLQLPEE